MGATPESKDGPPGGQPPAGSASRWRPNRAHLGAAVGVAIASLVIGGVLVAAVTFNARMLDRSTGHDPVGHLNPVLHVDDRAAASPADAPRATNPDAPRRAPTTRRQAGAGTTPAAPILVARPVATGASHVSGNAPAPSVVDVAPSLTPAPATTVTGIDSSGSSGSGGGNDAPDAPDDD